jgi:glutamine---fructose-6-phosphate transaminase (isomerizing)
MCGILGICAPPDFSDRVKIKKNLEDLFVLSETRGKEASGMALFNGKEIRYLKSPFPASDLISSKIFSREINGLIGIRHIPIVIIGHSRLVTNGYEHENSNNQPVVKNGMLTVHNGIITNELDLWKKYPDEKKETQLDSELIPTLLNRSKDLGFSIPKALRFFYKEIHGMTTFATLFSQDRKLIVATNNGSLYYIFDKKNKSLIFASERYFLNIISKSKSKDSFWSKNIRIHNLKPNHYILLDFEKFNLICENFESTSRNDLFLTANPVPIVMLNQKITKKPVLINRSMEHVQAKIPQSVVTEVEKRKALISRIKRCTKCILPETFPYISYDEKGVCNYCHGHQQIKPLGLRAFKDCVDHYKRKFTRCADCLVPFSGGRDSSFALHFVKEELGMNPIAFSYDWGMLTDLARRNQSRMCGALNVEHILVSADIRKKREYIRKNVLAWLKRPRLGTIPLFMAGDKQFFYFINLLMKQNNVRVSIFGENLLETTRFKSGFCGIKPNFDINKTYTLGTPDKIKMAMYYAKEYMCNPGYLNSSLLDTLDAFKSYYIINHFNINIYDYIPWDEEKINSILINNYQWETDPETSTTWRIGDGTAAFYNYIYYMLAGFTENDTFRSNQVREGQIEREEALISAQEENLPRFDSINWYCSTIDIDFSETIKQINVIPTLY